MRRPSVKTHRNSNGLSLLIVGVFVGAVMVSVAIKHHCSADGFAALFMLDSKISCEVSR